MIYVDTSVLIDYLKNKNNEATKKLAELENNDVPFGIPAICCQEILQGSRDKREWELLHAYLTSQEILTSKDALTTHVKASEIFFKCRKKGFTIRSSIDCIIAQQVIEINGILLHKDKDFETMKKVCKLKTLIS